MEDRKHVAQRRSIFSLCFVIFLDNPIRRWLQPPSELVEKLGIKPSDVIMDFGCGPGFYTVELAKKAERVLAVDLSPEMLEEAQNKAAKAGVKNTEFLQSDGKNVRVEDNSVDLILLLTVYHEGWGEPNGFSGVPQDS